MKSDKKCDVGHLKIFISNVFWLTNSNQDLMQFKKKESYVILYIP